MVTAQTVIRKRSPRSPSIPLNEAIERAMKVYDAEGKHSAPVDVIAQHLGYRSASNGAAKSMLASLGYYGLFDRPAEGMLAVSKTVEEYKFSPTEAMRLDILRKWLRTPGIFSELLDKYASNLPSAANLKFDLIQRGFSSATADECINAFVQSVNYASYYKQADQAVVQIQQDEETTAAEIDEAPTNAGLLVPKPVVSAPTAIGRVDVGQHQHEVFEGELCDRIPVRLSGGRKAWLVIPSPFYSADKRRLISQIELLLTDDEDQDL